MCTSDFFLCFFQLYFFFIISERLHKNTYNEIDIPIESGGCAPGNYAGKYIDGLDIGNEVQMWILNSNQNDTSVALCLTHVSRVN